MLKVIIKFCLNSLKKILFLFSSLSLVYRLYVYVSNLLLPQYVLSGTNLVVRIDGKEYSNKLEPDSVCAAMLSL